MNESPVSYGREDDPDWWKSRRDPFAGEPVLPKIWTIVDEESGQPYELHLRRVFPERELAIYEMMAGSLHGPIVVFHYDSVVTRDWDWRLHSGNLRSATKFCLKQREKYRPSFATRVRYFWWWLVSLTTTKGCDLHPRLSESESEDRSE
jgi:hypothetical protein